MAFLNQSLLSHTNDVSEIFHLASLQTTCCDFRFKRKIVSMLEAYQFLVDLRDDYVVSLEEIYGKKRWIQILSYVF